MTPENTAKLNAAARTFEQAYLPMMAVKDSVNAVLKDIQTREPHNSREAAALKSCVMSLQGVVEHLDCLEHIDFDDVLECCPTGALA